MGFARALIDLRKRTVGLVTRNGRVARKLARILEIIKKIMSILSLFVPFSGESER